MPWQHRSSDMPHAAGATPAAGTRCFSTPASCRRPPRSSRQPARHPAATPMPRISQHRSSSSSSAAARICRPWSPQARRWSLRSLRATRSRSGAPSQCRCDISHPGSRLCSCFTSMQVQWTANRRCLITCMQAAEAHVMCVMLIRQTLDVLLCRLRCCRHSWTPCSGAPWSGTCGADSADRR